MNSYRASPNEDINIVEFLSLFLKYKFLIGSLTILSTSLVLLILLFIPNKFQSSSFFYISSDPGSTSSSMKLLSNLSSLGGLADFNLPSQDVAEYDITMSKIKSRDFLVLLLEEDGVKESIYAAKDFDFKTNQIIFEGKIYDEKSGIYLNKKGQKVISPDIDDIHYKYLEMLNISRNNSSGIMQISFTHYSPYFASEMISLILSKLDELSRSSAITELNKSIDYFEKKLLETNENELKLSLNSLIKTKLEQLMLANVKENYLINIISEPFVPKYKSEPRKTLIAIVALLASFLISTLLIFIYHFLIKKND